MDQLIDWFKEEKRDLPWRKNPTPYQVWVSEVMLQQTQVSVVVGYFERWMAKFPTIQDLAIAPLEEVMKVWEGLGYYARVRHMHEAAKKVVEQYGGELPGAREELEKIKGFGPYTVGAVLSFAFHQRAAAVDGNVRRVVSRLFATHEDITHLTEKLLPAEEPWVAMEALIELGAIVCQKKPKCSQCPLREKCLAYSRGEVDRFPAAKKRETTTVLERDVAIITFGQEVLLKQGVVGKVMGGLYEFPYVEKGKPLPFEMNLSFACALPRVEHGFTRYRAILYPTLWKAEEKNTIPEYHWVPWEKTAHLPFSSGHKRILLHAHSTYRKF